jgi:hypothetical protein
MLSNGGCFVAGTPVSLSSLPRGWQPRASDPWSQPQWLEQLLGEESDFFGVAVGPALAQAGVVLAPAVERVAIDAVPLGGRVPTRNPRRWEYDGSLPEPDEANWAKLSITVQRSDGGVVDAELLRPRAWIELHGIVAGQLLPLHLPELEVSGQALVTAVEACPPIAGGEGSVVTARFVTREVHVVASVDVLGLDGSIETITGTTIHPVWSVDREDWVPLGELVQGETLQGEGGVAVVLSVTLSRVAQPVYNLEVHGEHVYQVGELGLVVHNAGADSYDVRRIAPKGLVGAPKTFTQRISDAESLISRHAIDMTNAPVKSARNALGFLRNGPWFWRQLRDQKPEMFSPENLRRIKNREAPIVDETWLKYNQQHASYLDDKLIHHHIDQGRMASGLPETIHQKLFELLHRRTLD